MSGRLARMGDAVTVADLPPNLEAYAGYVDGPFANFDQIVKRFYPRAHCLSITVQGGIAACADFEPGAMNAADAGRWVKTMIKLGHDRPICYAALEEDMPAVRSSLVEAGLNRGQYRLWVADANDDPAIPAGYDAKQYLFGNGFDLSTFTASFFPALPKKRRPVHPKVKASVSAGALVTAITAAVHQAGLKHLTPAEVAAVATAASGLAGYFKRA